MVDDKNIRCCCCCYVCVIESQRDAEFMAISICLALFAISKLIKSNKILLFYPTPDTRTDVTMCCIFVPRTNTNIFYGDPFATVNIGPNRLAHFMEVNKLFKKKYLLNDGGVLLLLLFLLLLLLLCIFFLQSFERNQRKKK